FRLRLSEILQTYQLNDTDSLVGRLLDDRKFYESFISDISIGSPDMFRDPDFWIYLRDHLLPTILKTRRYPEILIPESVTGNELYTVIVLLREMGLDYRVDLAITCWNNKIRDQIMNGELPRIRYKNSMDNYQVFKPGSSLEEYTDLRSGTRYLKKEMLQGVEFRLQSPEEHICSEKTALVLYRNRMIYQNAEMQYRMLKLFLSDMKGGTYFITGIQEAIDGFGVEHLYNTVSSDLKIYQKKDAD
ncbi:CheR family methyltransferase, partial [Bacteroidota bacterium]